ncbi:MAG: hypothetical protein ACUVR8_04005 [Acidobacteriota bacterium]
MVSNGIVFPAAVQARIRRVPPILLCEPEELHNRETARRRLGVPEEALALWLSAGGGGDALAERTLTALIAVLEPLDDVHLVVGAGPLFVGTPCRGRRITWLTDPLVVEDFAGLDAAISAAGFKATHELLAAGVPTARFTQEKVADDQAVQMVAAGSALSLPLRVDGVPEPAALAAVVAELRQAERRAQLREKARAVVALGGARQAGEHAMELLLTAGEFQAAVARMTLPLCRRLEEWRLDAASCARLWALTAAVTDGDELAEWLEALPVGMTMDDLVVFLQRLPRLTRAADVERVFAWWQRLGGVLGMIGDEPARAWFLRQMPWSQQVSAEDQVRALTDFLAAVKASGDSLYRAVAVLMRHTAGKEFDPWQWLSAIAKAAEEVRDGGCPGGA